MEFQRERVYTALNADELHEGDKVIVADDLVTLKHCVKDSSPIDTIRMIGEEDYIYRFGVKDNTATFALAYLVERKENCTNCERLGKTCNSREDDKITCCFDYKPKTEQKCEDCKKAYTDYPCLANLYHDATGRACKNFEAEKDCDNCGQRCDGYGKGEVCSQWKSKAEEKNCYNCRLTYTRNGVMRCMMNDQRCYNPEVACYHYEPTTFEKHTDYNHCEEAKKAYVCAMTNACPEKHYRPFKDVDELIKVWEQKWSEKTNGQKWHDCKLNMPLIWVKKHDDTDRGKLIISFSNNGCSVIDVDEIEVLLWEDLFNIYTFLDGSPCGVEE